MALCDVLVACAKLTLLLWTCVQTAYGAVIYPGCISGQPNSEPCLTGDEVLNGIIQQIAFNPVNTSDRQKRQAMNFDNPALSSLKWQASDMPIRYVLTDSFAVSEMIAIVNALGHIEAQTCLRFHQESLTTTDTLPHLLYQPGSSCVAFLGRITDPASIPQAITLDSGCLQQLGEIVHYTMHALGFWHEEQRPDRDSYVTVFLNNVQTNQTTFFQELTSSLLNTFGLPYDYGSLLHFAGLAYSTNGQETVQTTDPLYQHTIGQRVELSFIDAKLINSVYCQDSCSGVSLNCSNSGYPDPNNCAVCKCPDGYSGPTCNELAPPVGASCGGNVVATPAVQILTSPNAPGEPYDEHVQCNWQITAPAGFQIQYWFVGPFSVYCDSESTCFHWVEIRARDDMIHTGPRFCCQEVNPTNFTSLTDTMMIIFKSNFSSTPASQRMGFSLAFKIAGLCAGVVCENGGSCDASTGQCFCPAGFIGVNCEFAIVSDTLPTVVSDTTPTVASSSSLPSPSSSIATPATPAIITSTSVPTMGADRCLLQPYASQSCGGHDASPGQYAMPCYAPTNSTYTTTCQSCSQQQQAVTSCGSWIFGWNGFWCWWWKTSYQNNQVCTSYSCSKPVLAPFCCGNAFQVTLLPDMSIRCAVNGWTEFSSCQVTNDCPLSDDYEDQNFCGGQGCGQMTKNLYGEQLHDGGGLYYQIINTQTQPCGSSQPCQCSYGGWCRRIYSWQCCNDGYSLIGDLCVKQNSNRRHNDDSEEDD